MVVEKILVGVVVVVTKCEATFDIYTREVGPIFPLLNIIIIIIFKIIIIILFN
jgi:hypothetical protein